MERLEQRHYESDIGGHMHPLDKKIFVAFWGVPKTSSLTFGVLTVTKIFPRGSSKPPNTPIRSETRRKE